MLTKKLLEKSILILPNSHYSTKPLTQAKVESFRLYEQKKSEDFCPIQEYLVDERWKKLLKKEFDKPYFREINKFLEIEYNTKNVMPPKELIFNAFNLTKFRTIKVVIIGQDPYSNEGQAHGLAFSVPKGIVSPPSLKNIFAELKDDIDGFQQSDGCLVKWAEQGVFLLNSILTVEAHKPCSHSKIGWETFTDVVIKMISAKRTGCVFLLWGAYAQTKAEFIDPSKHMIIACAHPSPYSAHRFFYSKCFSKTNSYLASIRKKPINWSLQ